MTWNFSFDLLGSQLKLNISLSVHNTSQSEAFFFIFIFNSIACGCGGVLKNFKDAMTGLTCYCRQLHPRHKPDTHKITFQRMKKNVVFRWKAQHAHTHRGRERARESERDRQPPLLFASRASMHAETCLCLRLTPNGRNRIHVNSAFIIEQKCFELEWVWW